MCIRDRIHTDKEYGEFLIKEAGMFEIDELLLPHIDSVSYTHLVYSICAPVIPVQECHKAMDVCNPAFEVEYFRDTLRIAGWWAERLGKMCIRDRYRELLQ